MRVIDTAIKDVKIIEPEVFIDKRGFFFESYHQKKFQELTLCSEIFVQDNHSKSIKNTLRGLHFQKKKEQVKLVRVILGEIFDVAVDIRQDSETYGHWVATILSAENKKQLLIPKGFAHGFLVLSREAEVLYKTSEYYAPQYERSLLWSDPCLNISWPLKEEPLLSEKDEKGIFFKDL